MRLYLVPASPENLEQTIQRKLSWNTLEKYVPAREIERLRNELGERPLHCWAVTRQYEKDWREMEPGDHVLIKTNGAGAFTWSATICSKLRSTNLGSSLWPYAGEKPWELIYFLENLQSIRKDRLALVREVGYKENEHVQHFINVAFDRVTSLITRFGTLQAFIDQLPESNGQQQSVAPFKPQAQQMPGAQILVEAPDHLNPLCRELETLQYGGNHLERTHESLVEQFYRANGWVIHEEIQFQQARVNVLLTDGKRPLFVNEVKRDWGLNLLHSTVRKQGYHYAQELGARFVVITNGDYYALYDRDEGNSYEDNFQCEFRLSALCQVDIENLARFHRTRF